MKGWSGSMGIRERIAAIRDAMTEAVAAAFSALSGSSLTTIAGFLSLCAMQFTLGRDLGIVMAKGIVVGILAVVLILPCFILIFDRYIEKWQHRSLFPDFTNFNRWILKHRRIWILLFVLMLIPSYYSDKHTDIYYRISRSLPEDLPSLVSQRRMEELFDIATEHIVIMDGGIDNAWFMLRLSVHDPVMVLNAESEVPGGLKHMMRELYAVLAKDNEELDLTPLEQKMKELGC